MRKFVLTISFLYIFVFVALAQNIQLSFQGNPLTVTNPVCFYDTATNIELAYAISVKNTGTQNKDIRVRKFELNKIQGTWNSFCWGSCIDDTVYLSPDAVTVNAGTTDELSFTGEYKSKNHPGKTIVMYTFFDAANPNDSASYIAIYYAGSGMGINNASKNVNTVSAAFPSPAKNSFSINYSISDCKNAKIELRNVIGNVVGEIELNESTGVATFDVSDLKDGVYFYTLITDNKARVTKRVVIQR